MKMKLGNLSAPNLVNICVDQRSNGEISGRLYHCYSETPIRFWNAMELLREAEHFFDSIVFPQASTKTRSFLESSTGQEVRISRDNKKMTPEEVAEKAGEKGTFLTNVRFRQNANWQGELYWKEKEQVQEFSSVLEFIKVLDDDLSEVLQKD